MERVLLRPDGDDVTPVRRRRGEGGGGEGEGEGGAEDSHRRRKRALDTDDDAGHHLQGNFDGDHRGDGFAARAKAPKRARKAVHFAETDEYEPQREGGMVPDDSTAHAVASFTGGGSAAPFSSAVPTGGDSDDEERFLSEAERAATAAKVMRRLRGTEFDVEDVARDHFAAKLDDAKAGDALDELSDEEPDVSGDGHDGGGELDGDVGADGDLDADGHKRHWAETEGYSHTVEPFNLRDERKDGFFDAGGFFVARKFAREDQRDVDSWLDAYDREDVEKRAAEMAEAKRAHDERAVAGLQRGQADVDGAGADESRRQRGDISLLTLLVDHLEDEQTPAMALRTLNMASSRDAAGRGRGRGRGGAGARQTSAPVDKPPPNDEAQQRFTVITEACNELMQVQGNLYHESREALRAKLVTVLETRAAQKHLLLPQVAWEYRTTDGPPGQETHGPFPTGHMLQWYATGYFRPAQRCEIRRVSTRPGEESSSTGAGSTAEASTAPRLADADSGEKGDASEDDDIFDVSDDGGEDEDSGASGRAGSDRTPAAEIEWPWEPPADCPLFAEGDGDL